MRLNVFHETRYRYRRPVVLGEHRMMLSPRAAHDLRVLSASILCEPPAELRETEDVFSNKVTLGTFAAPTAELVVTSRLVVEQTAPEWPVFRIATHALSYPFEHSTDEIVDLGALRLPETSSNGADAVASWAHGFPLRPVTDTLSLLKDINASIVGFVDYRTRDEEGTQKPAETLASRSGSCRDIAALFIEAVRVLGFGARAASGYIHDLQALAHEPRAPLDDAGSTHAWAEVYLPDAGWIAFDPTHRRVGGAYLIPTAVGRRNDQIMPIRGSFTGDAADYLDMEVEVVVSPAS